MARTAAARKPEVLPVDESPDVQLVTTEGSTIRTFLGGLVPFFTRATELERHAMQLLNAARLLEMPTNGKEDAMVQGVIKTANASKKTVEQHWGITQAVHSLHRKLTAKRAVAVQALEEAANTAQRLHNRYVAEEEARVRREDDARRREAEERARIQQEREAAQLEQAALDAEARLDGLSDREDLFVDHYHRHGNATLAAKTAGYKDAAKVAMKLLDRQKIKSAIEAKVTADAARRQATAVREQPLIVNVEPAKADVQKVGTDRTTWSAEIIDATALIHAVIAGKVPFDVLMPNPVKLNDYARQMEHQLDYWPGVRAKKTTRTV